jgi:DNA-binding GntR family transcriptional regulator
MQTAFWRVRAGFEQPLRNRTMTKTRRPSTQTLKSAEPSPLHAALAARILRSLHDQGIGVGHHLVEQDLCRELRVSRTPIRGALELLAQQGCVKRRAHRGFILLKPVTELTRVEPPNPQQEEDQQLFVAIARARNTGKLPVDVAQKELVRMFDAKLTAVMRVLRRMAELELVERKPGIGWSFMPSIDPSRTRSDSYTFRRAIETAGLLAPTFELDRECAVQRQIQLGTFMNYQGVYGAERVLASIDEHLAILNALVANRNQDAAVIMEGHLLASHRATDAIEKGSQ